MFDFYLDGIQVKEPESFTNISFEKKRNDELFGFIQKKSAGVPDRLIGAGQIKFTEDKAVQILKAAKEKSGYGAKVTFKILYLSLIAYEGSIDFWESEWYSNSIVVKFLDDISVLKFIANIDNRYQLTTNAFQTLSSTGIVGKATHEIIDTLFTFKKKTKVSVNYSHPIPFEVISGSSNANVSPITSFSQILPLYTNDAEKKTVSIKGDIYFNVKTSNSGSFELKLNDLIIQEFVSDLTPADEIGIIDKTITLQPYESITISINSLVDSEDTEFIYDVENTTLSINEIKDNLVDTEVPVLSSFDAFSQLINKSTDGELELESTFLQTLRHDITNGRNLRGVPDVINCSFSELFADYNKMYCLFLNIEDKKVIIEQRINLKKKGNNSGLDRNRIDSEVYIPNVMFLYSSVKAGFKEWKGENALSNQEVNSYVEFNTNIFSRQNTLDLVCNSIGSGLLIEEIRQKQFGKISTEQQNKYDDMLVNLIPNDGADNYSNSGLNQDIRNLSIRPYQMLLNWAAVLGGFEYWEFISGLGNYNSTINGVSQTKTIEEFGNIIGQNFWNINYKCDLSEYTSLGDVISWTDTLGIDRTGILYQAEWGTDKKMFLQIMENETL